MLAAEAKKDHSRPGISVGPADRRGGQATAKSAKPSANATARCVASLRMDFCMVLS